ncbi:CAP domain-containing protein [Halomarina rubra]|uniref:CAP domain-containing protein n=1 Tax=Halomarina rubra TaxID=2071873 RepID=A0ABD6AS52_9EURY|nr:hypothetical protein [Halomarina rubra]
MVNKVLIVVLGAVVLASLVVGGLLGMQLAGSDGNDTLTTAPTATDASTPTPAPNTTPTPSAATATPTPASTTTEGAASTPATTPEPKFSPSSVNTTAVELELRALVDEEVRADRGPLESESVLDEMAQFHATNMAKQGYVDHTAGGYNTKQRYEKFERYSHCRVPTNDNSGLRDGQELEVNKRVSINVSGDWTEEDIAQQVLAEWRADEDAMERLRYANAEEAGMGVAVSQDARVYVAVDLC